MSTHILVVFTGGTIGSTAKDGVIGAETGKARVLLRDFAELRPTGGVTFDAIEPVTLLSENSQPLDWCNIANAILDASLAKYDGIVVTHGTDTLAWASAALAYLLSDVVVPVVIVASNQPLENSAANGLSNFSDAVSLIELGALRGVFVAYRNPDGRRLVHLGARLVPARHQSHDFRSVGESELGEFLGENFHFSHTADCPNAIDFDITDLASDVRFRPMVSDSVVYIQPYPGLDYSKIAISKDTGAVVHDLYHSGTACVNPGTDRLSVLPFAEECRRLGIPLFLTPVPVGGDLYETTWELVDRGAVVLSRISVQAAFVKIVLAAGNAPGCASLVVSKVLHGSSGAHEFLGLDLDCSEACTCARAALELPAH